MNNKRRCALERLLTTAKTHIGHVVIYGDNEQGIVEDAQLIGENIMIKLKSEVFATVYIDSIKLCSCGN